MATEQEARGKFTWYDLMTTDIESATKFYTALIGWELESWTGSGEMPYTMWKGPKGPLGGVMPLPDDAKKMGAPPNWIAYVFVPDLDATCAKVTELGGQVVVPPTEIPNVGSFAILQDPQGAVFAGLSSPEDLSGPDEPPQVGQVSWHELMTNDYEAAFAFYSTLFGWEKGEAMDMGPEMGGTYQMFARKGTPLGGMFNRPAQMSAPPMWIYYIRVDDVEASVEKAKSLGACLVNGPEQVPGGDKVAQLTDPQGALFALHSIQQG